MENIICINNVKNKRIYVNGDKTGNYISVLEAGYVILKDGTYIILSNNHGESLTDFYFLYHDALPKKENFTTYDAIPVLAHDGFVMYIGTKRDNRLEQTGNNFGFALLYLPNELTEEQKIACKKLLDTNYQILNPTLKKVDIQYGCGENLQLEYSLEEVMQILNSKVKTKV